MKNLGQIELNLSKILDQQEKELKKAEKDFFISVETALTEAVKQITLLRKQIFDELINPLEDEYGISKDKLIKTFLSDIQLILRQYVSEINQASGQFRLAFGWKVYDSDYKKYFDEMYILYTPKYSEIHVPVYYTVMPVQGLGAIPIAVPILKSILTGKVWESIADKLTQIPVIKNIVLGILSVINDMYRSLWYAFKPEDKSKARRIELGSKFLESATKYIENGFNVLISAIDKMQTKLNKKLNAFISKLEIKEKVTIPVEREREVYVPYTILPEPLKKTITLPSGGRAEIVEYKREYKPVVSGYTDKAGAFFILQYATRILIPKERFPYATY